MKKSKQPQERRLHSFIKKVFLRYKDKKGQTLVEYGLLLILIAVVVIFALTAIGKKANNLYNEVSTTFPSTP